MLFGKCVLLCVIVPIEMCGGYAGVIAGMFSAICGAMWCEAAITSDTSDRCHRRRPALIYAFPAHST